MTTRSKRISILPKVLAVLPDFIPSTQIGVVTPMLDLCISRKIDFRLELESTVTARDIDWSDIVILCRNTEPGQTWFQYVLQHNKPYIYDIDDNFFDISGDTPEAKYHRSSARLEMLTQYLRCASLVRVYSEPLRSRALSINTKVIKTTPPIDFRHICTRHVSDATTKIVYTTSRAHDELFSIFLPALEKILNRYSDQIDVYFLGFTPPTLHQHPRVHSVPMVWDYPIYLRNFSAAGYDIGLAPLVDDIFHRSKTNNKFREYGACQVAGIYSDVDVYSSCVRQRETGILVSNKTSGWYEAIALLIENPSLRQKIQSSAYEFVRNNYSQEEFVNNWKEQINHVLMTQNDVQCFENDRNFAVKSIDKSGIVFKIINKFSKDLSSFSLSKLSYIKVIFRPLFLLWKYKVLIMRGVFFSKK